MTAMPPFDTLRYSSRLQEAGLPAPQAEAMATALVEAFDSAHGRLATRADLAVLEARMDARFAAQDVSIDAKFAAQDARIDAKFAAQDERFHARFAAIDANFRVVYWMLGVLGSGVGALVLKAFA